MTKIWKPCTKARYWEMLEILPPAVMGGGAFMVGEPINHDAQGQPTFRGFKKVEGGKFFETVNPMNIQDFAKLCPDVKPYAYTMQGEYC
jgi:hypothetical protein